MDKLSQTGKIILIAGVAVIIIALIFIYGAHNQMPTQGTNSTTTGDQAQSNVSSNTTTTTDSGSSSGTTHGLSSGHHSTLPPIAIKLITPVANDQWIIGNSYPIAWNPAGNFTGEIDLLDGLTHTFIGVILSETGPQQTSYSWNAREYALARYSPLKKEVLPGTYAIRIKFDGNNLPTIISPTFTITN